MENLYSTTFIVDISQNPDEVDTIASRIQQLIEDHGGIIKEIDRWGKRRLGYSINSKSHGFYVEIEFTANSRLDIPKILEAEYRINDRVLRHLTYVIEKKELDQRAKKSGREKTLDQKSETVDQKSTDDVFKTETPILENDIVKDESIEKEEKESDEASADTTEENIEEIPTDDKKAEENIEEIPTDDKEAEENTEEIPTDDKKAEENTEEIPTDDKKDEEKV